MRAHHDARATDPFRLVSLEPDTSKPPRAPLPLIRPPAPPDLRPDEVVVRGLYCGRDHFNDPRARYCATCGLGMVQTSFVLLEGIRPPVGLLVLDNGESHPVTGDLVIGRDPLHHPLVEAGMAKGLVLGGGDPSVSRHHALIRVVGWDAQVSDLHSKNGTFAWDSRTGSWHSIGQHESFALQPSQRLAFGPRTAVFESSLRA